MSVAKLADGGEAWRPAQPDRFAALYAELEAAPENLTAEIISGQVVTQPKPSPRHSASAMALYSELGPAFQKGRGGPGGWWFFVEVEVRLGDNLLVADLAGWRRERLDAYPEKNYFEIAPDWVCEVLSPSTQRRDRNVKRRIYAEFGVPFLWLLDPSQQLLEAFALADGEWRLTGSWTGDDIVRAPPFEAIAITLADLWPLDRPLGFAEDPQALYAGDR